MIPQLWADRLARDLTHQGYLPSRVALILEATTRMWYQVSPRARHPEEIDMEDLHRIAAQVLDEMQPQILQYLAALPSRQ